MRAVDSEYDLVALLNKELLEISEGDLWHDTFDPEESSDALMAVFSHLSGPAIMQFAMFYSFIGSLVRYDSESGQSVKSIDFPIFPNVCEALQSVSLSHCWKSYSPSRYCKESISMLWNNCPRLTCDLFRASVPPEDNFSLDRYLYVQDCRLYRGWLDTRSLIEQTGKIVERMGLSIPNNSLGVLPKFLKYLLKTFQENADKHIFHAKITTSVLKHIWDQIYSICPIDLCEYQNKLNVNDQEIIFLESFLDQNSRTPSTSNKVDILSTFKNPDARFNLLLKLGNGKYLMCSITSLVDNADYTLEKICRQSKIEKAYFKARARMLEEEVHGLFVRHLSETSWQNVEWRSNDGFHQGQVGVLSIFKDIVFVVEYNLLK